MSDPIEKSLRSYRLRAKMPQYLRYAAVAATLVAVVVVMIGFYRERNKTAFRLKGEHTQLSTDVVAEISGYERLETEGDLPKYYIKADHAKTFADDHQEFQNLYLEVYAGDGTTKDVMSSETALYIPEPDKNFTAYLKGNVNIETRQALKIKTNHVVYTKRTEIAEADEAVEFDRQNVRGRSFGAVVHVAAKRIELLKDVEIETFESPELARSNLRYAKVNAGSAVFDQAANRIELQTDVSINIASQAGSGKPQDTDIKAQRASLRLAGNDERSAQLKDVELFDAVRIVSLEQGGKPTNIEAGYAFYDKAGDRFELKKGTHIVSSANEKPTDIRAAEVVFERTAGKAALTGGAEVKQGSDVIKGDSIFAKLFADNSVKDAIVRGNASAVQSTPERTTTITAPELNAAFNDARQLRDANAVGQSHVEIVPIGNAQYSLVVADASRGIGLVFRGEGQIETMRTDGRTTINLNAPGGAPNGSNKKLTADAVKATFHPNGKDMQKAEAAGAAELYVEPLVADAKNYKTTINAPRFDCEFYPAGNNVRSCVAGQKVKTTRVPMSASARRGTQTLTADQMTADFGQGSNDIETFEAAGNAKFTELDRSAVARQINYARSDEVVRLRGGEPTVWDARARAKADEIDWHTSANKTYLRGTVSTTYYNPRQMGGAAPFGGTDRPVFITAGTGEFDHAAETAVFTQNARGWQDKNYVRGDRIAIDQKSGTFVAEGNVESALYNARIKNNGKETTLPTSASAGSLTYQRETRILQYRTSVDIRQGTDRITAGAADVFLDEQNEVARTVAENSVVITQPGRRATGQWAQYTAADETAVLRGDPATVSDAASGSSQSSQLTFFMRDKRVIAEGKSSQNPSGRSRSVYKVRVPNE